jgi:hypothetical protein
MRLILTLAEHDVRLLDAYVKQAGLPSRSAAIQRAIRTLRYPAALEEDYANAWQEVSSAVSVDPKTGLPLVSVGMVVTSEDVRSSEDEE